jgi:alanine racemase
LSRLAKATPISIFIEIDCGFGRFGIEPETALAFAHEVLQLGGIHIEGVYTHVPFSDFPGLEWARQRVAAFNRIVRALAADGIRPRITQAVASPGLFGALDDPNNAVAVGHALYGLDPFAAGSGLSAPLDLQPALTAVRAKLVHVGSSPPMEDAASYLRHRGHRLLGVIPVGIHHSYRPTDADAFVLVNGQRAPVLRPCLENSVIDLSDCAEAQTGAEVTIIGTDRGVTIGVADLARWQNTSTLAILSGFGRALPRFYRVS